MYFQEDVALHCSRRHSLVSLDNESQCDDDDDGDDDGGGGGGDGEGDEEENESDDDNRSLSVSSTVDRSEVSDVVSTTDDAATPLLYQMFHTLGKVCNAKKMFFVINYLAYNVCLLLSFMPKIH